MSELKLVKASAGSGKTFVLTIEYLTISLKNPEKFKNILAITFTNKAAGEMKSRILNILYLLSKGIKNDYFYVLQENTNLEDEEIKKRSELILKKILHNYSYFSVKTIDSFFQQIIRAFLFESGLYSDYNLELNYDYVLNKAVDNLFLNLENDKELLNWLIKLAEEKIEDSKSWNLKNDIILLSEYLFKEELNLKFDEISQLLYNKQFLEGYINQLRTIVSNFEKEIKSIAQIAIDLINNYGYTIDDFKYKKTGVVGFFENLANGDVVDIQEKSRVLKALESVNEWLPKEKLNDSRLINLIEEKLLPLLKQIYEYFNNNYKNYITAKILIGKIYILGILNDVKKFIYEFVRSNNLFLITDSAKFLYEIIDGFDTPFVYEKAGINFQHLLLDEFQDTSILQWQNIKPLLINSLSQGNECLIVGDVKQSLYRWRNSTWEILARMVEEDFSSMRIRSLVLEKNFRSSYNIVCFNNSLFNILPEIVIKYENDDFDLNESIVKYFKSLYANVVQKYNEAKNGGYIKFKIFDDKNVADVDLLIKEELIKTIKLLLDYGYLPGEIAILTRTNIEAEKIAEFIIDFQKTNNNELYKFELVSEEALTLSSSTIINFIISIFRYINNQNSDVLNNYYLLFEYLNLNNLNYEGYFNDIDINNLDEHIKKVLPQEFVANIESLKFKSLDILLEEIIQIFNLNRFDDEQLLLHSFKDLVHDYIKTKSNHLYSFLDYWEESGKYQKISCPENTNAIRILTIHKAKGLEFKAVIIPYCDWKIDKPGNILWSTTNEQPFGKINLLPVDYSKNLKKSIFSNTYYKEKIDCIIDNMNLLYVAFTRPIDSLFCFIRKSHIDNNNFVSKWIYDIICSANFINADYKFLDFYSEENMSFEYGEINKVNALDNSDKNISIMNINYKKDIKKKEIEIKVSDARYSEDDFPDFSSKYKGVLLHQILSKIKTTDDIKKEVNRVYYEGKITYKECEEFENYLSRLLNNSLVKQWFSGDYKILNERSIVSKNNIRRPDRIMINENSVIVIDYKSGKESIYHKKQLKEYVNLLYNMGYKDIKAYLWYFLDNKIVEI